ncbi:unnamed protein product [Durusdinium trenchii]|uniref:Ion transport domain-containing protein n=1 Tax=Durusdinium trenchii TaxID=1381693 RepID=A0ABP0PLR3_9DINO
MASLERTAMSSFDVATSLLIQCRIAHQELQRVAGKEGKLLNRLCDELQYIRNESVPEAFEVALRTDSEMQMPREPKEPKDAKEHKEPDPITITVHDEHGQLKECVKSSASSEGESSVMKERRTSQTSEQSVKSLSDAPLVKRISVHSTESRPRTRRSYTGGSLSVSEGDIRAVQSYSINGIRKQDQPAPRHTVVSLVKANFAESEKRTCSSWVYFFADFLDWLWKLQEPPRHGCLARVVRSNLFGAVCGAVILMNAIFILYATDYEMRTIDEPLSADVDISVIEVALASFYVLELLLKLIVHRLYFFWNDEMAWNWFDAILVLFSIIENLLLATHNTASSVNLGFLRLVRLCKIVKILRVFRTLRFFSELRLMLDCVVGSLMNVFWCVIMLLFVIYVFALLLQQGVVQYLAEHKASLSAKGLDDLMTYFGSVGVTIVTLFQSCTSGVDWNEPYSSLFHTRDATGDLLPVAFLLFVAFVHISVWNIMTSTFVEKALKLAQPDIDMLILEQQLQDFEDCRMLTELFKKRLMIDQEGHERLGLEEFRKIVETYEFRSYLQTRGHFDS